MQGGYFSYGLLGALAIALLYAAYTDLRRRQIENWLNAAIALGAPLFWYASGISMLDVGFRLAVSLIIFLVLLLMFVMRAMGGGDVKLLTALALWIEPLWFLKLLVVMSIAGGLLTVIYLAIKFKRKSPDRIEVPYGIAISLAGLWTIFSQHLPGLADGNLLG